MRPRVLPLLACTLALAACAGLPPQDFSDRPHASLVGSHAEIDGDRVDTFRVTALNGWPVNRAAEQDPSRTLGVDLSNAVEPGRPLRVEFEGVSRYRNTARSLFWSPNRVEGSAELTPAADARYVVRGALAGEAGSTVWLENEATHEVIGRKFTVAPAAAASGPDAAATRPGAGL
jgi:hypothetical protein